MKLFRSVLIVSLNVILGIGLVWATAKYFATPPPSGEPYRLVPNWPSLPNEVNIGQVSGVDVDSHGAVFVFHRADRVWAGEELALDFFK